MARAPKLRSSHIFEAELVVHHGSFNWLLAVSVGLCLLSTAGCPIPFDDYAEGELCEAGRDAGIRSSTAGDPVLRACDAESEPEQDPDANSAGAGGSP